MRIQIIMVGVVFLGTLFVGRLFMLQIIQNEKYVEEAERQYIAPSGSTFNRGTIYFSKRDGATVAAATVASGFKLAITPSAMANPEETFEALSKHLVLDREDFLFRANRKSDTYEDIAKRIPEETAEAVSALRLPGVNLYREKWRFYPGGELAAQTIGFLSYKGNTLSARYGLERVYDDVLLRAEDKGPVNFFAEIFANLQSSVFKNRERAGDVITSIEPSTQGILEDALRETKERWESESVGGMVLDPRTGEILAMAGVPSFDLNQFSKAGDVAYFSNPLVERVYELGSVIKPLVMAAAIDAGAVNPKTTYQDRGSVAIDDRVFSNFDKKGRGVVSMQEVLSQSLNTGMVFVYQKLGKENLRSYLLSFGLGEKTGIDMPGEVAGLVSNLKAPGNVPYATASFGQGLATTPVAFVRAFSALANDGRMVVPHVARKIVYTNGREEDLRFPISEPVLKPETVETMKDMLVEVVDKGYGRGLPHHSVAAKTGTAQVARPGGGGYYDDRHFHSLIGFFPASDPRLLLYLFQYYPKGASFAAQTLADPFFEMVESLVSYYEIPPDR